MDTSPDGEVPTSSLTVRSSRRGCWRPFKTAPRAVDLRWTQFDGLTNLAQIDQSAPGPITTTKGKLQLRAMQRVLRVFTEMEWEVV